MVKRQQPFSQRIIISCRHWHYSICTEVTCVLQSIINYDLDIMNILVVSLQICYVEVFNITSPLLNKQIWPVPSDFVKSRFHCTLNQNLCRTLQLHFVLNEVFIRLLSKRSLLHKIDICLVLYTFRHNSTYTNYYIKPYHS